jgi:Arc/MetJ-type ribon-helix-helix transcriptional regulator
MNVTLRGKTLQVLNDMIAEGYANTKSEAIRLAILNFGEEHDIEEIMVKAKLDKIDKQIREGKRKVLTPKQALGKYAKYIKG